METAAQGVQKSLHETQASLEEPVQQLRRAGRGPRGQRPACGAAPAADASEALPARRLPQVRLPRVRLPQDRLPPLSPPPNPRTIAPPAQNPNLALDLGPEPAPQRATPRPANARRQARHAPERQRDPGRLPTKTASRKLHLPSDRAALRLLRAAARSWPCSSCCSSIPAPRRSMTRWPSPLASLPQHAHDRHRRHHALHGAGQVTMMAAFIIALPVVLYQPGPSSRRACTAMKSGWRCR